MLIKLPDGMWIDPKTVKAVFLSDDDCVLLDIGSADDLAVYPEECKQFKSDKKMPCQELADKIANQINDAL